METQTESNRMFSLIVLYDMHTAFFTKALDGISDKDAHSRLNTKANHIAWLTGSLVQQRSEIARSLGIDQQQAANELFKNNKGIQDNITYPKLSTFESDWESTSPKLREAFVNINDNKLNSPFEMPGITMTFFDMITFIIYREANILGQIALWRRLLGYEAMKYM
ncbi:MAG: DinB family protein [Chitinophagales bacterium]|nr:DinB family protein [Chitinophagales bacterium]